MKKIFILFLSCFVFFCNAQTQKYWVFFKDKKIESYNPESYVSKATITNRRLLNLPLFQISDVPVNVEYVKRIQKLGIQIAQKSKWLNAVSVYIGDSNLSKIKTLDFVEKIERFEGEFVPCSVTQFIENEKYYIALQQMNAEEFVKNNLTGKNIKVGITDVGFSNAKTLTSLSHVFEKGNFLSGKDYVGTGKKNIFSSYGGADWHGAKVWERIAGYKEKDKTYQGLALNSVFYLAITDHSTKETRRDEDNWVRAIEWMDSLGVRVINTSLGYNTFDNASESYKTKDMNGKTSVVAQAAAIAWKKKGITLVMSAGNEGSGTWRIVTTPGDVEPIISVGATNLKSKNKIYYSSKGADFVSFIKPNVSCYSPNGTSFSAPIITGVVACMLEKNPRLSNDEIKIILQQSSHLYPYANNFLGYGVPNLKLILDFLEKREKQEVVTKEDTYKFSDLKTKNKNAIVFHKKDKWFVIKQEKASIKEGKLEIKKHKKAKRTTVDLGDNIVEIFWED